VTCLLQAQQQGETAAWVQLQGGSLYPPDLAASGIDLEALILVQVPKSAGAHGIGKAAELLLRSGGFGFLVLDLVGAFSHPAARQDLAFQGRLLGLVREHDSTLVLLTEASAHGSFGPLVSICIEPQRTRSAPRRFAITHRVRKDKTGSLSALAEEPARELI
jgi:recombination protein RecA